MDLHIRRGPHALGPFQLHDGPNVAGRADDCDILLPSRRVSRHHCVFELFDGRVTVRDLGSHNGLVGSDGRRVSNLDLEPGDEVLVGDYHLGLTEGESTTSTSEIDLDPDEDDEPDPTDRLPPRVRPMPLPKRTVPLPDLATVTRRGPVAEHRVVPMPDLGEMDDLSVGAHLVTEDTPRPVQARPDPALFPASVSAPPKDEAVVGLRPGISLAPASRPSAVPKAPPVRPAEVPAAAPRPPPVPAPTPSATRPPPVAMHPTAPPPATPVAQPPPSPVGPGPAPSAVRRGPPDPSASIPSSPSPFPLSPRSATIAPPVATGPSSVATGRKSNLPISPKASAVPASPAPPGPANAGPSPSPGVSPPAPSPSPAAPPAPAAPSSPNPPLASRAPPPVLMQAAPQQGPSSSSPPLMLTPRPQSAPRIAPLVLAGLFLSLSGLGVELWGLSRVDASAGALAAEVSGEEARIFAGAPAFGVGITRYDAEGHPVGNGVNLDAKLLADAQAQGVAHVDRPGGTRAVAVSRDAAGAVQGYVVVDGPPIRMKADTTLLRAIAVAQTAVGLLVVLAGAMLSSRRF